MHIYIVFQKTYFILFRGAIMFPSYEGYRPNLDLNSDDIKGIQALYGPAQVKTRFKLRKKRIRKGNIY